MNSTLQLQVPIAARREPPPPPPPASRRPLNHRGGGVEKVRDYERHLTASQTNFSPAAKENPRAVWPSPTQNGGFPSPHWGGEGIKLLGERLSRKEIRALHGGVARPRTAQVLDEAPIF